MVRGNNTAAIIPFHEKITSDLLYFEKYLSADSEI